MFDNVTPRVGSGDFNRHSNCRRFQFSVALHTESGDFNSTIWTCCNPLALCPCAG